MLAVKPAGNASIGEKQVPNVKQKRSKTSNHLRRNPFSLLPRACLAAALSPPFTISLPCLCSRAALVQWLRGSRAEVTDQLPPLSSITKIIILTRARERRGEKWRNQPVGRRPGEVCNGWWWAILWFGAMSTPTAWPSFSTYLTSPWDLLFDRSSTPILLYIERWNV